MRAFTATGGAATNPLAQAAEVPSCSARTASRRSLEGCSARAALLRRRRLRPMPTSTYSSRPSTPMRRRAAARRGVEGQRAGVDLPARRHGGYARVGVASPRPTRPSATSTAHAARLLRDGAPKRSGARRARQVQQHVFQVPQATTPVPRDRPAPPTTRSRRSAGLPSGHGDAQGAGRDRWPRLVALAERAADAGSAPRARQIGERAAVRA